MQYVDLDLISKWWGEEIHNLSVGTLLRYAAQKDVIDLCMPFKEYVNLMMMFSDIPEGYRDKDGRPYIQVAGITITALIGEDADKYRVLK